VPLCFAPRDPDPFGNAIGGLCNSEYSFIRLFVLSDRSGERLLQRKCLCTLELRILDGDRTDADLHHAVAALDRVILAGDQDVVAVEQKSGCFTSIFETFPKSAGGGGGACPKSNRLRPGGPAATF
jgi:hypothetical protein